MLQAQTENQAPARTPLDALWARRGLIWQLACRDVEARYRSSMLGVLWAVALPVAMFGVYLFVFTAILRARWETPPEAGQAAVALFIFSGLIVFTLFSETVNRAPSTLPGASPAVGRAMRFSARMRPPWASTICLEIDRPSPEFCPKP